MGIVYSCEVDKYFSNGNNETLLLGESFAKTLHGGEVLLLNGDLGAGKTTFTKGIAKGLGINDNITSPTFTIMKQYNGKITLCHYDMYRIVTPDELEELGLSENLYEPDTVSVIEWNKFDNLTDYISISFSYINENKREIVFLEVKQ